VKRNSEKTSNVESRRRRRRRRRRTN